MVFDFGVVRAIRKRDSIRRAELAKLLGVTDNYLYRLEKGLKQPSLTLIQRISDIIGVPIEYLFQEHAPPEASDGAVIYEGARTFVDIMNKVNRERQNRMLATGACIRFCQCWWPSGATSGGLARGSRPVQRRCSRRSQAWCLRRQQLRPRGRRLRSPRRWPRAPRPWRGCR